MTPSLPVSPQPAHLLNIHDAFTVGDAGGRARSEKPRQAVDSPRSPAQAVLRCGDARGAWTPGSPCLLQRRTQRLMHVCNTLTDWLVLLCDICSLCHPLPLAVFLLATSAPSCHQLARDRCPCLRNGRQSKRQERVKMKACYFPRMGVFGQGYWYVCGHEESLASLGLTMRSKW